jgi:hypothetical protein
MAKGSSKKTSLDSAFQLSVTTIGEQGILESFFKLPQTEGGLSGSFWKNAVRSRLA